MNTLYYGDNLDVMRRYIKDESVDLIYLDPPFNSKATYNVLFGEKDGTQAAAQIKAFDDTWTWDPTSALVFQETIEAGGDVAKVMLAFKTFLGESDMLAYLSMMAPRLKEMWRVLKPSGSIYLHCDPTASHYIKILMDAVFSPTKFLNEIVWCYETGGRATNSFPKKHDIIFRYCKGNNPVFNYEKIALPRDFSTMHEPVLIDENGRKYQRNIKNGKEYRYYLDKGVLPNDWWVDIQAINPAAKERLGYPTQKPEELLERIILASSNENDVVLDPFCGCGTAIAVAERLHRKWIGIDITQAGIVVIKKRLFDTFAEDLNCEVIGEPVSAPDAEALAKNDPYQFQWWSLGLVGARPTDEKKGSDKGIDGRLYFHEENIGETKQVIFSVKAGHTNVSHIRDLRGVLERENAEIGVLITMQPPTQPMISEAASCGFYQSPWGTHPKMQILTIEELLDGKQIDMPPIRQVNKTFKKAKRQTKNNSEQPSIL